MGQIGIVGCGFVADLYMRSFSTFPHVKVIGVYDKDDSRRDAFCKYWSVPQFLDFDTLIAAVPVDGLVLNLTNPSSHTTINRRCLEASRHIFCEKPLSTDLDEATELMELARSRDLQLASAPSSVFGESAQTLARAVRNNVAGKVHLIYAELDDGFISQAPVKDWISESGAPWPYVDEFRTGCTLEHAGYYLSWLIAIFGPIRYISAASATLVKDKVGVTDSAPDFTTGVLYFDHDVVARLTCSIIAPHDHQIRVIGDRGILSVKKAWDNSAPVRFYRRFRLRRRLLESPVGVRIRSKSSSHPKVGRWGSASMNFALGPVEMLRAIEAGNRSQLSGDFSLHLTEATLTLQAGVSKSLETSCSALNLIEWK